MTDYSERQSRITYWIPPILVAILISFFSTRYFSAEETGSILIPLLHWLFPWATRHTLHLMHFGIRKLAHVSEFGLFSILVFRGLRAGQTGWRLKWALPTLAIAVAYAALDEWHQSFVPLRGARARDVAIDATGALLAQTLVWLYARGKWGFPTSPAAPTDAAREEA